MTIILGSLLVVFSFHFALASNPRQCKQCLELSAADCARYQVNQICDSTTIGVTHCASAEGLFVDDRGTLRTGFARGCINCTDKEKACQDFATFLKKEMNFVLKECEIECCTSSDCNSATTPSLPSGPTTCYSCLQSTAEECKAKQVIEACRLNPKSLGITHCGSAAIRFTDSSGVMQKGFVRGCINCADTKKGCEHVSTFLKEEYNYTLNECEPECCDTTNCNTATPTLNNGIAEVLVLTTVLVGLFLIF